MLSLSSDKGSFLLCDLKMYEQTRRYYAVTRRNSGFEAHFSAHPIVVLSLDSITLLVLAYTVSCRALFLDISWLTGHCNSPTNLFHSGG